MKKIHQFILLTLLMFTISLTNCDNIEDPVIPVTGTYDIESYGIPPTFEPATEDMIYQRVVIEDFTGHKCGNCPEAAITAETIKEGAPSKVSIIAVHAGDFTEVDEAYPEDWTSEIGDFLWANIPTQINPGGRVNRAPVSNVLYIQDVWSTMANEQLALDPQLVIQIKTNLVEEDDVVNIHVFSEMLSSYSGNLKLVIYLTESGLVGSQLDYSQDPSHLDEYDFEYVLRDAVNGNVGVSIANNPSAGFTVQKDYSYNFNTDWNITNCHVVAVVYDGDSEIIINSQEIDIE